MNITYECVVKTGAGMNAGKAAWQELSTYPTHPEKAGHPARVFSQVSTRTFIRPLRSWLDECLTAY